LKSFCLLYPTATFSSESTSNLLAPTRRAPLFRWCLEAGMRAVKPMNLMTLGDYQEPSGAFFPSVLY